MDSGIEVYAVAERRPATESVGLEAAAETGLGTELYPLLPETRPEVCKVVLEGAAVMDLGILLFPELAEMVNSVGSKMSEEYPAIYPGVLG